MNSVGVHIPDLVEGEPDFKITRGMRSRDEIERLQYQFRQSVQSVLDVEVGPALEGPNEMKEVA